MEKCVFDVMAKPDFKEKYPDEKERKSHAIAICHTSIMGEKKGDKKNPMDDEWGNPVELISKKLKGGKGMPNINFNFYGDYWKSVASGRDETNDNNSNWESGTEKEEKKIDACVKEKIKDGMDKEEAIKTCRDNIKENGELVFDDMQNAEISEDSKGKDPNGKDPNGKEVNNMTEVKKQSGQEGEGGATDAKEEEKEMSSCMKEMTGKGKSEAEAKKACKSQMKEHEAGESKEEENKEQEKVEKKESAEPENVQSLNELLKSVIEKVDKLVAKSDATPVENKAEEKPAEEKPAENKEESAPAEGVTPTEEAPKGGEEAPKEEAPKEGASPEGAEVQKAVNDVSQKVDNSLAKFADKLDSISQSMKTLTDRVVKLEEQPMPSKVASTVVVSKTDNQGQGLSAEEQERLGQVKKELDELKEMQTNNIQKYQEGRYWEKAFKLVDERDRLLAKNYFG